MDENTSKLEGTEYLLYLIAANGWVAWVNTFGNPSTNASLYHERMARPERGDLVLEITNWGAPVANRIGRLLSVMDELPPKLDPETYDPDKWGRPWPPYLEKVWRIKTLDGRDVYWTNANFIAISENPFDKPKKSAIV
jgi:hypothetical protein